MHKLIRRVHLYLGLALLPWVLLYGLTVTFLIGNLWPIIRDEETLRAFADRLDGP